MYSFKQFNKLRQKRRWAHWNNEFIHFLSVSAAKHLQIWAWQLITLSKMSNTIIIGELIHSIVKFPNTAYYRWSIGYKVTRIGPGVTDALTLINISTNNLCWPSQPQIFTLCTLSNPLGDLCGWFSLVFPVMHSQTPTVSV